MSQSNYSEELRRKQKFWSSHIDAWSGSGLSKAEYCRRQNLKSYQFSYWVNRKPRRSNSVPALVEVSLPDVSPQVVTGSGLQLVTRHGERLNINDNFSAESFEKVMLVLRRLS